MAPVVISFYTIGTPYEVEARKLAESCERFDIEYRIEGIASRGSWERNCAFKPAFILQKLKELNRPIVWVDADARFKKHPEWETFSACDFSLRLNPHLHRRHTAYFMSGTIFVNPTPFAIRLLEEWEAACEKSPDCWDQVILARLLEKNTDVRLMPMPFSYVKTLYWDGGLIRDEETVIEHGQATRENPPPASFDAQKREFLKKRKAGNWSGIVDYHPSMLRQAGDCCFSLLPFVRSLVVIMHASDLYSAEERRRFAFLARLFPFATFIDIGPSCPDRFNLFADTEHTLALSAGQVVDTEQMVNYFMTGKKDKELFLPWQENNSEIDIFLHPYFSTPMAHDPPNLIKIDEQRLEQLEVARHLGLPLKMI